MAEMVNLSKRREEEAFLEKAVTYFRAHAAEEFKDSRGTTTMRTYTEGEIAPGVLFAMRWGLHDRAVMVFRVGDQEPVIYCDIIPEG